MKKKIIFAIFAYCDWVDDHLTNIKCKLIRWYEKWEAAYEEHRYGKEELDKNSD